MMRLNQDENPNDDSPQCLHCGNPYSHFEYDLSSFCTIECKSEWFQQSETD